MYSKPSNSDWSILLMTSLCGQAGHGHGCRAPSPRPTTDPDGADSWQGAPSPCRPPRALLVVRGQLHGLAGELGVEVVQTVLVGDLGLERREGLLLLQLGTTTQGQVDAVSSLGDWGLCGDLNHRMEQEDTVFHEVFEGQFSFPLNTSLGKSI